MLEVSVVVIFIYQLERGPGPGGGQTAGWVRLGTLTVNTGECSESKHLHSSQSLGQTGHHSIGSLVTSTCTTVAQKHQNIFLK